jgi:hypothetical protein
VAQTHGWALMRNAGGRFHWGLNMDEAAGTDNLLGMMWPNHGKWLTEQAKMNALGTFSNNFLINMGLTGKSTFLATHD